MIKVQTDHKALIPIWKKSITTVSPPLQCSLLRLARYDAQLTYLNSKDNVIADALSQPTKNRVGRYDSLHAIPLHHIKSEILATGS